MASLGGRPYTSIARGASLRTALWESKRTTNARHKLLILNHRVSFQDLTVEGSEEGAKQEGNSEGQRKTILLAESAKTELFVLLHGPKLQVFFE